ncbi:MAG TPA: radical SAM protein, partial [Oculatellaceae cyanobacterium]
VDGLTLQIANTFKKGGQKQLTLAIETGSDRMRRRINKNLKHEQILEAASVLSQAGLEGVKFYGMVGLPDETDADVEQLAELLKEVKRENPKLKIHLGCSSFVPKGGTPFQWQPKIDNKLVDHRFSILRKNLLKVADVRASSAKWDYFQAFLSRGDRRLSKLLVRFYELGGSLGAVNRAYKELKAEGQVDFPDLDWYALRERPEDEILPWDMINLGTPKHILYKEGLPPPGFERSPAVV